MTAKSKVDTTLMGTKELQTKVRVQTAQRIEGLKNMYLFM